MMLMALPTLPLPLSPFPMVRQSRHRCCEQGCAAQQEWEEESEGGEGEEGGRRRRAGREGVAALPRPRRHGHPPSCLLPCRRRRCRRRRRRCGHQRLQANEVRLHALRHAPTLRQLQPQSLVRRVCGGGGFGCVTIFLPSRARPGGPGRPRGSPASRGKEEIARPWDTFERCFRPVS